MLWWHNIILESSETLMVKEIKKPVVYGRRNEFGV